MLPSQPWRRASVVVAISLGIHAAGVLALAGRSFLQLQTPAVQIEIVTTPPVDLPLGAPAPPAPAEAPPRAVVAKKPKPKVADKRAPQDSPDASADAGQEDALAAADSLPPALAGLTDAGRPSGLRPDGPEGARLVVRLRLDRLRDSPSKSFTTLTDELLKLLPDRSRLIDGSGLHIFDDFDTLVVATPNPLDDAVTFLAVHHHLSDDALMNALGRAATANGRPIEWIRKRGRPVGLRPLGSMASRDDRVFVLPDVGWAVIAPGAYMKMLVPELGAGPGTSPDAGVAEDFSTLTARIRGEEAAMPQDAVLMVSAAQLLAARAGQSFTLPGSAPLDIPQNLQLQVKLSPEPVVQLKLGFAKADSAAAWTKAVPELCRQFAPNPMVMLMGMTAALGRVKVTQTPADLPATGADVLIEAPLTSAEAERILTFSTNMLRSRLRR